MPLSAALGAKNRDEEIPVLHKFSELGFNWLSPEAVQIAEDVLEVIKLLSAVGWILKLARQLFPETGRLQARVLGLGEQNIPASIGANTWTAIDDRAVTYRRAGSKQDLPPFNDIGLAALPSAMQERIVPKPPNDAIYISSSALVLGGTRINPVFMSLVTGNQSGLPFQFQDRKNISPKFPLCEPTLERLTKLHRGFVDPLSKRVYSKPLKVGRYVVDTINKDRPPLGPCADDQGIRWDVLILSILPNLAGGRTIVANAGYGAASRIASILLDGSVLEAIAIKMEKWDGDAALQAAFMVPQQCNRLIETTDMEGNQICVAVEEYGVPDLTDAQVNIQRVENWRTNFGQKIMKEAYYQPTADAGLRPTRRSKGTPKKSRAPHLKR